MLGHSAILGLVALILAPPATAHAHLGHTVQQAERYLKLDVSGFRVRLVVSLTLGARETSRLMEQADADRNGWVSSEERDTYMAEWGNGLREELRVSVDGRSIEVTYAEPFMEPVGPIVATSGSVEMVGEFVLDGGDHHVVVADGMPAGPFERTDFSFRARDAATLLKSGIGRDPTDLLEHVSVHRGSTYPAAFAMRVRVPHRPLSAREQLAKHAPWIAALGSVALLLMGAAGLRRRSRRRALPG